MSVRVGNDRQGTAFSGYALHLYVEFLAYPLFQAYFYAALIHEAPGFGEFLPRAVLQHLEGIRTPAEKGTEGNCYGQTGHTRARDTDAHRVLEYVRAKLQIDFLRTHAEGFGRIGAAECHGYRFGATRCRYDFPAYEFDNLLVFHIIGA